MDLPLHLISRRDHRLPTVYVCSGTNAGTMFGEGVYLADDGAKADQYTRAADTTIQMGDSPLAALHTLLYKDGSLPATGVNYMFLCRVGIGCSIRTKNGKSCLDAGAATGDQLFVPSKKNRRKQLGEIAGCTEPKVPYHTLLAELGDKIARFREVVVFDGARVYPEYLLAYSRLRKSAEPEPEPQ
jgi:hypothetical protein